jgi:hypothetical protein
VVFFSKPEIKQVLYPVTLSCPGEVYQNDLYTAGSKKSETMKPSACMSYFLLKKWLFFYFVYDD